MNFYSKIKSFFVTHQINRWVFFVFLIYLILIIKLLTYEQLESNILFGVYSLLISFYIISRFALAMYYKPEEEKFDKSYEPTLTFGIPSKNEGDNIYETIMRIATADYPIAKFDIIAINDGSTDNTLAEMQRAKKDAFKLNGATVRVIDWEKNKGKREGMAACVSNSKNDIIVFIDSDSFVEKNTARELIKYFNDDRVAAVAGHAYVANADVNMVTKMQAVRYFVAFKAYKAAEAVFGSVTCCSGCCSAYRRDYTESVMKEWLSQRFLGVTCTYGDDRSLTNYLLKKGYRAMYSPNAIVHTFAPDSMRKFMKQQLRWKKSWVRESLIAGKFMWKRHPIMSLSFYLGVILPLLAPLVVVRALVWYPIHTGQLPWFYLFGLFLMAFLYGYYYRIYNKDNKWIYGILFANFYTIVLIWQLPYAILNLRDARWGTR